MSAWTWVKAILLLAVVLGLELLLWFAGKSVATTVDSAGPLTWGFCFSTLPLGLAMFVLTRAYRQRYRRALAAVVVITAVLSGGAAALISASTGVIVTMAALNFPFLGVSLGWQLGWQLGGGLPSVSR